MVGRMKTFIKFIGPLALSCSIMIHGCDQTVTVPAVPGGSAGSDGGDLQRRDDSQNQLPTPTPTMPPSQDDSRNFTVKPTWAADIQPLINQHCASCHSSRSPRLVTYDQVKNNFSKISSEISRNAMPPGGGAPQNMRDKLEEWSAAGFPM